MKICSSFRRPRPTPLPQSAHGSRDGTILAKRPWTGVSLRDPDKTYHIVTKQQLVALSAGFDWNGYLKGRGRAGV